MAIVRVQTFHTYPASTGASYAFGSNNAAGNLIVVCVCGLTAITGTTSLTITDTQGNVYIPLTASWNQSIHDSYSQIWYTYNCKAGANSIIATFDYLSDVGFQATEYSGIKSTADPLDVAMAAQFAVGNNTTSLQSNSFSPQAGSLIVTAYSNENVDPGTTTSNDGITQFEYGTGHYDLMGDSLSASAGSQTFTLSFTNSMGSTKYYALSCACFLPTGSTTYTKSISETGSATDSLTEKAVSVISESGTATDTVSFTQFLYPKSIAESGTASDTVTFTQFRYAKSISETASASDTPSSKAKAVISEAGSASDTPSFTQFLFPKSISETGSATDSVTFSQFLFPTSISESGTASDSYTYTQFLFPVTISESGTATDTATFAQFFYTASISEAGSASDSYIYTQFLYPTTISESGTASDTPTESAITSISESGSAVDTVAFSQYLFPVDISENGIALDNTNFTQFLFPVNVSETGLASDTISATQTLVVLILESGAAVDNTSGSLLVAVDITESGLGVDYTTGIAVSSVFESGIATDIVNGSFVIPFPVQVWRTWNGTEWKEIISLNVWNGTTWKTIN